MSGSNVKKSLVSWHTRWFGERDANGDLGGDWVQYFDKEQFKCNIERKCSNGGRSILNLGSMEKGRVAGQPGVGLG